jgi:hypothetical protein
MSTEDYFWKAFEATGSPQIYMLYKNQRKNNKFNGDDWAKRNANL